MVLFLALLLAGHLAHNILLSPLGLSTISHWWMFFVWLGVYYSQPSLLAVWAAFGDGPVFRRVPRALFLVGMITLALMWGIQRNGSGMLDPYDLGFMVAPITQFLVTFILLWVIRKRFHWLVSTVSSTHEDVKPGRLQFNVLGVLEWVTAASILLSFGTLLIRNSSFSLGPPLLEGIVEALLVGILTAVFSLPIALSVAMVLGVTGRRRFAFWSFVLFACELGSITMLGILIGGESFAASIATFSFILASFHVSSIATLCVGRVFGFRLTRYTQAALTVG